MHGVGETCLPSTTVKLSDTWCPANCQPHVRSPGVPNSLKQYRSGLNRSVSDSGDLARSTCSMAMIDTTLVYAGRLVPVTISSCPSRRWPSSSAPTGSPSRSVAGRNDQLRRSSPNA